MIPSSLNCNVSSVSTGWSSTKNCVLSPPYFTCTDSNAHSSILCKCRPGTYEISNVDITYDGQLPKLNPYIPQIRKNLSEDLEIAIDYVSCKATTTDFLGFEGSKEGVSCHAVALLKNSF